MRTYQTVVIIKSDLDDSQVDSISEKIKQYITKFSGDIVKLESWGKKRLAYRVRKQRYGIYLNICHTLEPSNISSLENELRLDETVLKYLVIRLEPSEVDRVCGEDNSPLEVESQSEANGRSKVSSPKESV